MKKLTEREFRELTEKKIEELSEEEWLQVLLYLGYPEDIAREMIFIHSDEFNKLESEGFVF